MTRTAAERFVGEYVSSNVFSLIGERPIAGRDFQPQDDAPGAPPVVILGRSIWESRYGGSAALIGSTLRVNGVPATVVGIMPDRSKFPSNAVVWQPLGAMPASASGKLRGSRQLDVFGRLKPGVSRMDAIGELQGIWSELIRRYPCDEREYPAVDRYRSITITLVKASIPPGMRLSRSDSSSSSWRAPTWRTCSSCAARIARVK